MKVEIRWMEYNYHSATHRDRITHRVVFPMVNCDRVHWPFIAIVMFMDHNRVNQWSWPSDHAAKLAISKNKVGCTSKGCTKKGWIIQEPNMGFSTDGSSGFIQNHMNSNEIYYHNENDVPYSKELMKQPTEVVLTKYWLRSTLTLTLIKQNNHFAKHHKIIPITLGFEQKSF